MTGLFTKKPLTRQQLAAINAKKRIGFIKDEQKTIRDNRLTIESQLKRNAGGNLSPQEQAVIVTANRSAKLEGGDLSDLTRGDRNEQTGIVLSRQREKLLKKEQDLEFQKNRLELKK